MLLVLHEGDPLVTSGPWSVSGGPNKRPKEVAISGWLLKRSPAFGPDHWNKQWCVLYEDEDGMAARI